jgi:hypothetical protein
VRYAVWKGDLIRPILDEKGDPMSPEDVLAVGRERSGERVEFLSWREYAPYVDEDDRSRPYGFMWCRPATSEEAERDLERRQTRVTALGPYFEGLIVVDGKLWHRVQEPFLHLSFLRNGIFAGVCVAPSPSYAGGFHFKVDEPTLRFFLQRLSSAGWRVYGDASHGAEVIRHDQLVADRERVFGDGFMRLFCREFAEYVPYLSKNVAHVGRHLDPRNWNGTVPDAERLSSAGTLRLIEMLPAVCEGIERERLPSKAALKRLRYVLELVEVAQDAVASLRETPQVAQHLMAMPFGPDEHVSGY